MNILALDIGGKTRNGFALMNTDTRELIETSYIPYDTKLTPLDHRQKILKEVLRYYHCNDIDAIVFERVNLFRGSRISPLANIMSLCKLQCTIIDTMSPICDMYDVPVRTWKAISLESAKADKDDSIKTVQKLYPDIDLKVPKYKKKQSDEFVWNHDLADAICIALAVAMDNKKKIINKTNKVNFL